MNSSHNAAAQALSEYKQHLAELPPTKQRVKIPSIRQLKERHGASGSLPLERGDHRFPSEWHQCQIWADTAADAAYLAPLHPHLDMKCTTCECVHQEYIFAPSTAWSASITAVGIIRHRDLQTVAGICRKSDIGCNCCCFGHKCFSRLKCCIKHGKLLGRCRRPYSCPVIWQDELMYNSKKSKRMPSYLQSFSFLPGSGRSSACTRTYAGQMQPQG